MVSYLVDTKLIFFSELAALKLGGFPLLGIVETEKGSHNLSFLIMPDKGSIYSIAIKKDGCFKSTLILPFL